MRAQLDCFFFYLKYMTFRFSVCSLGGAIENWDANSSDLLRTMDWAKVTQVCRAVESDPTAGKRVRSTAGESKGFAGAAGGPTGAPGQALQKRARS